MLGPLCCAPAFSSCGEWVGATLRCGARAPHRGGLSRCRAWASGARASVVVAQGSTAQTQQLWPTGLVAPRHVGSSRTRDRTMTPSLAGRFLTTVPPGKHPLFVLNRFTELWFLIPPAIFCRYNLCLLLVTPMSSCLYPQLSLDSTLTITWISEGQVI